MRDVPTGMDAPRRIQRKADSGPHCGEGRCSTRRTLMQEGLASERRAESGRALLVRLTAKGHKYRERLIKERRAAEEKLREDRKSTRLNSSHTVISYAVFCL